MDMKIRWSSTSTYLMLDGAERNRTVSPNFHFTYDHITADFERGLQHVGTFLHEIGREEEIFEKRRKFDALQLPDTEWQRVADLLALLSVSKFPCGANYMVTNRRPFQRAESAQQKFSSDKVPSLNLVIPAIEALHKGWQTRSERPKYAPFVAALEAVIATLEKYYDKTGDSNAYIVSMCTSILLISQAVHYMTHG